VGEGGWLTIADGVGGELEGASAVGDDADIHLGGRRRGGWDGCARGCMCKFLSSSRDVAVVFPPTTRPLTRSLSWVCRQGCPYARESGHTACLSTQRPSIRGIILAHPTNRSLSIQPRLRTQPTSLCLPQNVYAVSSDSHSTS
jgi:hypothetical protein